MPGHPYEDARSMVLHETLSPSGDFPEWRPKSKGAPHRMELMDTRRVVPSKGLPTEAFAMRANNNLDVVRHGGRVFLAWRTAPDHYADGRTRLHVVSSKDERTWRFEKSLFVGSDLREPRFLSWKGDLFLYVTKLGSNKFAFEPEGVLFTHKHGGKWSDLKKLPLGDSIIWRTRVMNGRPLMVSYDGGGSIYSTDERKLHVQLRTSDDGVHWRPLQGDDASVLEGGGSETDITQLSDGSVVAVVRNEAGDGGKWGSKVCRSKASNIMDWKCKHDARKYDSPLMFSVDQIPYLIGRRHVTPSGRYAHTLPLGLRLLESLGNQLTYILRRKRCSLWYVEPKTLNVHHVDDLPSRGDTCFASMLEGKDPHELIVYNYTSPLDGPDVSWVRGQHGATHIYRHVIRLKRR